MKKKIVFCLQTMILGGVEKELITVLKKIHDDFDITLLLLYAGDSDIMKEIPNGVNVIILDIDQKYYCGSMIQLVKQRLKRGKFVEATSISVKRFLKIGMTGSNINIEGIPALEDTYDTAICYHIHSPLLVKYVAEKINASRKIAWIHSDFFTSGYPIHRLKRYVVQFDEFVAVSKKVEREFRSLCPWYQGGICTAYNYMDVDEIIVCSMDTITEKQYINEKYIKLLTVGRFSNEKGIDHAIEVAALLKKRM